LEIASLRSEVGDADLPALTPYVAREHDKLLVDLVESAEAGASGIASLIGEPATGRKRAAWEAIHHRASGARESLLSSWYVWPGTSPSDPVTLLAEIARMPPKTVYWLVGADRYFINAGPETGNEVALALRALLGDPTRGPNLIICTFTPQAWQSLTAVPSGVGADQYQQVRLLLEDSQIVVPDSFTEAEARKAAESGDPRLAEAGTRAAGRRVIQYLAAAPWLDRAFETATHAARAILRCAFAVRRLGHDRWISRSLLERGALDFFTEPELEKLDENWFSVALEELIRSGTGGASLLTGKAPPVNAGGAQVQWFRLDEHIDRRFVKDNKVPQVAGEGLWAALVESAATDSLMVLAAECRRRRLLLQCNQFFRRAADENVPGAAEALIDLFRDAKRVDEMLEVYAELASAGSDEARLDAAEALIAAQRRVAAMKWLEPVADSSDRARVLMAMALADAKKPASAVDGYQALAKEGVLSAAGAAADLMTDKQSDGGLWDGYSENRYEPAIEWLTDLLEQPGIDTRGKIIELMIARDGGKIEQVTRWLHDRGQRGDHSAYLYGARLLAEHDRAEDALSWCDTAVEYGVDGARAAMAMVYAQAGFLDAAFQHARSAAVDDPAVLTAISEMFARKGLLQRALEGFRRAADLGDTAAWARAAEAAAEVGWGDVAGDFVKRAERVGTASAALRQRVAGAMCRSGKAREAIEWYLGGVDLADPEVLEPISDFLLVDETFHAAAEKYARLVHVSRGEALNWVAESLLKIGYRELEAQRRQVANTGANLWPRFNDKIVIAVEYWLPAAAAAGYGPAWLRTVDVLLDLGRYESAARRLRDARKKAKIRSEIHEVIILAWEHEDNADQVVAVVEAQIERGITTAAARTAVALLVHEKTKHAESVLIRGRDAGDLPSRVALADFWCRHENPTKALDEYFVALASGCDVQQKIEQTMHVARNKEMLDDFRKYGVSPKGELAKPWAAAASRLPR
jgi:tetratricopeptide (TPR) repeat protein